MPAPLVSTAAVAKLVTREGLGLPSRDLPGNWASGILQNRKLRGTKRAGAALETPAFTFSWRTEQLSAQSSEDAAHLFAVVCPKRSGSKVSRRA